MFSSHCHLLLIMSSSRSHYVPISFSSNSYLLLIMSSSRPHHALISFPSPSHHVLIMFSLYPDIILISFSSCHLIFIMSSSRSHYVLISFSYHSHGISFSSYYHHIVIMFSSRSHLILWLVLQYRDRLWVLSRRSWTSCRRSGRWVGSEMVCKDINSLDSISTSLFVFRTLLMMFIFLLLVEGFFSVVFFFLIFRLLMILVFPGVSASDEPDSVLCGGEQDHSSPGQPPDRRTAPPAGLRGVCPAAAGTPDCQEWVFANLHWTRSSWSTSTRSMINNICLLLFTTSFVTTSEESNSVHLLRELDLLVNHFLSVLPVPLQVTWSPSAASTLVKVR